MCGNEILYLGGVVLLIHCVFMWNVPLNSGEGVAKISLRRVNQLFQKPSDLVAGDKQSCLLTLRHLGSIQGSLLCRQRWSGGADLRGFFLLRQLVQTTFPVRTFSNPLELLWQVDWVAWARGKSAAVPHSCTPRCSCF